MIQYYHKYVEKVNIMKYDFSFYMPVNILGEKNALKDNKNIFSNMGKRCLIVTGSSSAKKSGALDELIGIFNELDIEYAVFDKITENPLTATCCDGGKVAKEIQADFVVGIGGGSPLDASKAVCVYATNPHIVNDGIYTEKVENEPLPLVVIGTTSGTGSEVSGVSVLTRENGRKQSISGKNYYADYAIADAKYTYSVPYRTTVSTSLDALAHAIESMFSPRADFLTQQFALISIKMIYPILEKLNATKDLPTEQERDTLYYASLYAGFALNKGGTGFPHGMGYALTEDYNVPHGIACAVFLPQYLTEAQKANPTLFNEVLNAMNSDKSSVEKLILNLCDLHLSVPEKQVDEYVARWETLKNFKNSPTEFNNKDAGELVKKLFP